MNFQKPEEFQVKSKLLIISNILNIIFLAIFVLAYIVLHNFFPTIIMKQFAFVNGGNIDRIFTILLIVYSILIILNLAFIFLKFNKFLYLLLGGITMIFTLPLGIISLFILIKGIKDYQSINDLSDKMLTIEPKIINNIANIDAAIQKNAAKNISSETHKNQIQITNGNASVIDNISESNEQGTVKGSHLKANHQDSMDDTTAIFVNKVINPNTANTEPLYNSANQIINLDKPNADNNDVILPKYNANDINGILENQPQIVKKAGILSTKKPTKTSKLTKKPSKSNLKAAKKINTDFEQNIQSLVTKTIESKLSELVKATKPKPSKKASLAKKSAAKKTSSKKITTKKKVKKVASKKTKPASVAVRNNKLRNKL